VSDSRYISRIDSGAQKGWYVRISGASKWFPDNRHGGKGKAWEAARDYRDERLSDPSQSSPASPSSESPAHTLNRLTSTEAITAFIRWLRGLFGKTTFQASKSDDAKKRRINIRLAPDVDSDLPSEPELAQSSEVPGDPDPGP
jgi:hypothetical protein